IFAGVLKGTGLGRPRCMVDPRGTIHQRQTAPVMFNTRPTIPNALAKRSPPALVYQRPCSEAISLDLSGPFGRGSMRVEDFGQFTSQICPLASKHLRSGP